MSDAVAQTPEQCVIFVGASGSRLGSSTADHPAPLLPVGDRPFLDFLLWHVARFGFKKVLLLTGDQAGAAVSYAKSTPYHHELNIEVLAGRTPLGTAGALRAAADRLDDRFILLNGHSIFDFNWLDLVCVSAGARDAPVAVALRSLEDTRGSGVVRLADECVTEIRSGGDGGPGLANAGVYLMDRAIIGELPEAGSLEADVLPGLAAKGAVRGRPYRGFFLDIDTPEACESAQLLVPGSQRRPAVFFDRDGVLNVDRGYVGDPTRFQWIDGACVMVKRVNDAGFFAFVVTNQSGVARGLHDEAAVLALHARMQHELRSVGAHIDDFRYCPHHPEGLVEKYAVSCNCRKPEPGMILDLLDHWPVEIGSSVLIGDKATDIEAGTRAGLRTLRFPDEIAALSRLLDAAAAESPPQSSTAELPI